MTTIKTFDLEKSLSEIADVSSSETIPESAFQDIKREMEKIEILNRYRQGRSRIEASKCILTAN